MSAQCLPQLQSKTLHYQVAQDNARRIDEHCAGTRAGDDGPVLRRLREVGVTGLAVGAFSEAPDDAQKLLGLVATTGAAERWRDAIAIAPT